MTTNHRPTLYRVLIQHKGQPMNFGTVSFNPVQNGWRYIPMNQTMPSRKAWPTPDDALRGRVKDYTLEAIPTPTPLTMPESLRDLSHHFTHDSDRARLCCNAANAHDALTARVAELEAALAIFLAIAESPGSIGRTDARKVDAIRAARAALAK